MRRSDIEEDRLIDMAKATSHKTSGLAVQQSRMIIYPDQQQPVWDQYGHTICPNLPVVVYAAVYM